MMKTTAVFCRLKAFDLRYIFYRLYYPFSKIVFQERVSRGKKEFLTCSKLSPII